MPQHFRSIFVLLCMTLFLHGCATIDSTTNVEWQTHQQRLANIKSYKSNGKLGYIAPEQRQSLNFQWSHSPTLTQLRMTTFLGQTALNLKATPEGATVETYDDQTFHASSPEALIQQLTGLSIPVEQLNDWMLGRPTQADNYLLNDTNTLASLSKQVGTQRWQLTYSSYQDVLIDGVALPLPRKMKLVQGETSINIVISKWTVNP
ncbi:lipoprotein insertase outer membrane protein LolB [Vibrio sp. M260118]|uniref:lipoprotein insertase outer membrane protein LolB n=1 Tax=Vibrio sp. M260118 TaxID=3020896 RepID=UPI002F41A362